MRFTLMIIYNKTDKIEFCKGWSNKNGGYIKIWKISLCLWKFDVINKMLNKEEHKII